MSAYKKFLLAVLYFKRVLLMHNLKYCKQMIWMSLFRANIWKGYLDFHFIQNEMQVMKMYKSGDKQQSHEGQSIICW